jgi:hypothetical protein
MQLGQASTELDEYLEAVSAPLQEIASQEDKEFLLKTEMK